MSNQTHPEGRDPRNARHVERGAQSPSLSRADDVLQLLEPLGLTQAMVARLWGCSRSTFLRRKAAGQFPVKPIKRVEGELVIRYDVTDVLTFLEGLGYKPRARYSPLRRSIR